MVARQVHFSSHINYNPIQWIHKICISSLHVQNIRQHYIKTDMRCTYATTTKYQLHNSVTPKIHIKHLTTWVVLVFRTET